MPFQRKIQKRHNAFKIMKVLQEKMLIFKNMKIRQEEFNIEDEEFSESILLEIQNSPTLESSDLKRKNVDSEGLIRLTSVENITKQSEEEKELMFNLEDDLVNLDNQKKENLALLIEPPRHINRRVTKTPTFKHTSSLKKNGTTQDSHTNRTKETRWDQEFERIHIFTRYFYKNNVDLLLKNYDNFMMKKIARIQKLKNLKKKKTLLATMFASSPQKLGASRFMKLSNRKSGWNFELSDENSPPQNSPVEKDLSISCSLENKKYLKIFKLTILEKI